MSLFKNTGSLKRELTKNCLHHLGRKTGIEEMRGFLGQEVIPLNCYERVGTHFRSLLNIVVYFFRLKTLSNVYEYFAGLKIYTFFQKKD